MKILFTATSLPLSKAIIAITGEPCSHCALKFGPIVIQSNLLGVNLAWYNHFILNERIIHTLERSGEAPTMEEDLNTLNQSLVKTENSFYDITGLLFVGICLLLKSWFKIPVPKQNLWKISNTFICTEYVQSVISPDIDSMITPEGLYQKLKASGQWKDVT